MGTRFYHSSGINIERMAHDLEGIFLAQGYQVQHFGNKEHMVVQLRKGSDFEAIIGMQAAIAVTLHAVHDGVIATIGEQQWADKAAAGAIGMLLLWPLALTAGAGIIRQANLENQLFNALDAVALQQRPDVKVGPVPPHLEAQMHRQGAPHYANAYNAPPPPYTNTPPEQPARNAPMSSPGKLQCLNCQEINEVEDFYCSRCGKPLALRKKRCPQCKAEVKSNAAFCTRCGTPFEQPERT
jgi:hypothetical protein